MAKKKTKKKVNKSRAKKTAKRTVRKSPKKITTGLATLALILNIIVPGIGSLIGGKTKTGIFQLILVIAVLFFFPLLIGTLAWIGAVVWGIVTGVMLIQESQ